MDDPTGQPWFPVLRSVGCSAAELPGAVLRGDRARRALGQRQRGKASAIAKIILLSDPDCLVQSHIPLKVSLAFPWLSFHIGSQGVRAVSRLFLGLIQRGHVRSQKVGLDAGCSLEF